MRQSRAERLKRGYHELEQDRSTLQAKLDKGEPKGRCQTCGLEAPAYHRQQIAALVKAEAELSTLQARIAQVEVQRQLLGEEVQRMLTELTQVTQERDALKAALESFHLEARQRKEQP